MAILSRLRGRRALHLTPNVEPSREITTARDKSAFDASAEYPTSDSDSRSLEARNEKEILENPNQITTDADQGIQKSEAVTLVWPRYALYLTYAWIWVCFFMLALHSAITTNVIYYTYSGFKSAPAITTAYILQAVIVGVLRLPIAKILTLWGRAEGLIVSVIIYVVGIIILAACNGPNGFAAGYVIYWIGYDAVYLILDVFIADTSGLRNRAFAFAFAGTPFICTSFVGPYAAQSFVDTSGWRWAFGTFAILQPVVMLPLALVFKYYQRKAISLGLLRPEVSGRTTMQSIVYYFHEFDVVGALLLMAAFVLFLLPFSLESYGRADYNSATFIAMVVIGFCLFPIFALWEARFARTQFIQWELFKQRTVLGACSMAAIAFFSFYAWDTYFLYFLRVVYNLDIKDAGYVAEIYNVGSTFWGVVFGVWIRWTKHFKYTCLFFGLPLLILGSGLMVHFRGSDSNNHIGYIVLCQIFIAFGGGTLVIGEDMAVMAASDRGGIPMMLALLNLAASLGGAIGYAVTSAIFAATFPRALSSHLPAADQNLVEPIYVGGYSEALSYPVGSVVRNAADYAWSASQKNLAITSTCILVLGFPAIAAWKNYRVDKLQNKGNIF